MEFFICKKAKKIISIKHCGKNIALSRCHDANGVSIHCDDHGEAVFSKKYTADEVFSHECISEYKSKCMAES